MKLKGVGFFEAHIEKLLLGLMVAVAAGVVVLQFAGSPNSVSVRNQDLPPARAYDPVERRAQEIDAQMNATNIELPEVGERAKALAGLEDRVRSSVSVRPRIAALGRAAAIDDALLEGQAEDVEYVVVTPPAPTRPIVASYAGTLDPALLADNEDLAAIVGPAQPFDLVTVSVETTYDGTALESAFRQSGQGDVRALPFNWWSNVQAFGLQLERQEQMANGSWGSTTVINGLPGEKSLFETLQEEAAADNLGRDQLASDARGAFEFAADYRRPLPLRTIAGPEWKPPTVAKQELAASGGADTRNEAQRLYQERGTQLVRKETAEKQREEAGGGQRGGDQGTGRGPRGPRQGGDPDPQDQTENRRVQALTRQIEEIDRRIEQIDAQMLALGYDPETGAPIESEGFSDTTVDARLLEDSQARLWAHDATAQPGKTYRYRTRLVINNPMFGREPVLLDKQKPLAASPVTFSEPSAWSDAVVVAPTTAFFLSSATDGRGGGLGPSEPSASIEVYTFYYGFYRRATLTLRPGDLVAAEADLPADLRLPVLAAAEGGGEQPLQPAGNPRGPGRGVEETIVVQPGGRQGEAGQQGDDAGQGEPVPDEVPASMEVYLVDVTIEPVQTEGVGDRTSQAVAYFSQLGGAGLMRRVATSDRTGELYQMLSRSAEEGRNQGQPRASLEGPVVRERPSDRPGGPAQAPAGGGGRGNSGGGGG
ncbi:MAG: hypothetical protein ACIAXF_08115 [Phycisphaerales bacterium JB063]